MSEDTFHARTDIFLHVVGERAYFSCRSLANVTIHNGVTKIGEYAFSECQSLINVTIPETVTEIGVKAFSFCGSLTSVVIPESVTKIGELAFCKCESLKNVTIRNGMAVIADNAFYLCKSLEKYTIFDYTIYEKQRDWTIAKLSEAIATMISTKDYSVTMEQSTKYNIVVRVFLKFGQTEAEAYIKKNITKILPNFIDQNDFRMVKALFESGKFITDKNIRKFLNYAKDADAQIQAYITDYLNKND